MSAVAVDIPSAVTGHEAYELRSLARGKRVLEVGSLLGRSTVCMAAVAAHVFAVDPHEGYPANDPRPTLAPFLDNLRAYGVRGKVTPLVGRDYEVLPLLRSGMFGFAFIDTTGVYEDTRRSLELVVPLLSHHAALAVHDCGHAEWPGVMAAVEAFAALRHTTFRLVDRLAIFEQTWA